MDGTFGTFSVLFLLRRFDISEIRTWSSATTVGRLRWDSKQQKAFYEICMALLRISLRHGRLFLWGNGAFNKLIEDIRSCKHVVTTRNLARDMESVLLTVHTWKFDPFTFPVSVYFSWPPALFGIILLLYIGDREGADATTRGRSTYVSSTQGSLVEFRWCIHLVISSGNGQIRKLCNTKNQKLL